MPTPPHPHSPSHHTPARPRAGAAARLPALFALTAGALVIAAGSTIATADEPPAHIRVQKQKKPTDDPERTLPEDPSDAVQKRNDARRDQIREEQRKAKAAFEAAGGVLGAQPIESDPLIGALEDNGTVNLNFKGDGIDLEAFIEYVRKALNINIMITGDGLAGKRVKFETSHEVPKDQLINLVAGLVEQQGFSLVTNDMGWYEIIQRDQIEPSAHGDLATTKVIPTPLLRPSQVKATAVEQLGGAAASLRISTVDDIGVLIVTGSPRTIAKLEAIVEQLRKSFGDVELRSIPLEHVSADWAIQRILQLNGILSQPLNVGVAGGAGGASGQVQANAQFSDLASRMWPDHGNTLLFRGDVREYNRILDLLRFVDVVSPLDVKRYIVGKSVNDVATAGQSQGLGNVETQQNTGAGTGGVFSNRTTQGRITRGFGGTQQQGGSIAGSRFIIDETTGSFLYFGTPSQHQQVEALVEQFTAEELEFKVVVEAYKLQYADAEALSEVLNEVLQDPTRNQPNSPFLPNAGRNSTGLLGLRSQLDNVLQGAEPGDAIGGAADGSITATADEVNIVADIDRNQIIVRASARAQRDIERIIRLLDRRQPQVMIEVKFVSVSSNDSFEWTVETEISPGRYLLFTNFGLGTPSTTTTRRDLDTLGNNTGISSARINSDYVPFVINALAGMGETKLLSNPTLLVNDNFEASFESQREEPFSETTQNANTTSTGQGGVAEAGTVLTITPTINSAGSVSLEYEIELSSFVGTPQAGLQPPAQRNRFNSAATVPGDSTIVVGGFVSRSNREVESRIPILGDIPIVGNLFKSYTNDASSDTLFVFITPRIVYDNDDDKLLLLSEGPMAEMGVDPDIPKLEPARMPIRKVELLRDRLLPHSEPLPVPAPQSPTARADSLSAIIED